MSDILVFDKQGNFVAEYPTVSHAAVALDARKHDIERVLGGVLNTTKGLQFKYKDEVKPTYQIGVASTKRTKDHYRATPVAMLDKNGRCVRIFKKVVDAANKVGTTPEKLSMHIRGKAYKRDGINGFRFKKANL